MQKKILLVAVIFLVFTVFSTHLHAQTKRPMAKARQWFVTGQGNDANSGKTIQVAFRSLKKAATVAEAGDVVMIGNGIYTDSARESNSTVLDIKQSGRPDAWITWKAIAGHHPELRPLGWNGIHISGSYHILDGLTVVGGNDGITLKDALADGLKSTPDPRFNTNGIFVNGRLNSPKNKPHHVIIRNCSVSKCPGGGIVGIETDYFTVEDCIVFDNAWYMRYGGSGITTLNNWAYDDKPGYHVIVQRNLVWNNKTLVPWVSIGKLSDGNGILLDVTDAKAGATNPNNDPAIKAKIDSTAQADSAKPKRPEWKGRALIANNISAYNGGSGIHTFRTSHVDIINNTTYWNGQVVGYQELFANNSHDIVIMNNIIVPRPNGKVTSNNKNTGIRWDYNLYPAEQTIYKGANDIVADPNFARIDSYLNSHSFKLKKESKARNSGTNDTPQAFDINGKKRPKGIRDRGAFEQ